MNSYFLHNLLLALPIKGFFWCLLIFALCFVGTHIIQLAHLGWQYNNERMKKPPTEKEKEEKKAPEKQEPIYYIVERKTRRAKASYKEPQQIRFKSE